MTLPILRAWALLAGGIAIAADTVVAQHAERRVEGVVLRPRGANAAPLPGVWVTIHEVGRGGGRALDSARTDARGHYLFRYRAAPDSGTIYFVSADHAGIAYFSAPLRAARVRGGDADLTVYDTTSAPVPIQQRGRHIVVGSRDSAGRRSVIEVYELSNDSSVTRVARGTAPVWEAGLPRGIAEFRVGEGDVSADAVSTTPDGRLHVVAPIAPGLKQLSFSYTLSEDAFPLSVPTERATAVLEVLVEDPRGTVAGAQLAEVDPVDVDGRSFRRFLARDVPGNGVVRIDVPRGTALPVGRYATLIALGLGAGMLAVLARSVFRRGAPRAEPSPIPAWANDPERLARQIAALDADFERVAGPAEEARATYELKRAQLKARLADALAARGRSG